MSGVVAERDTGAMPQARGVIAEVGIACFRYLRRNKSLTVGFALLFGLIAFALIGGLLVDPQNARPLSARVLQPPSWNCPSAAIGRAAICSRSSPPARC